MRLVFIIALILTGNLYAQDFEQNLKSANQVEVAEDLSGLICIDEGFYEERKKGFYCNKKSAEQGNAKAQFDLGLIYYYGKGALIDLNMNFYSYIMITEEGSLMLIIWVLCMIMATLKI